MPGFPHRDREYIIRRDLIIILLSVVQILPEHGIEGHTGIPFENVQGIAFLMPYLVAESVGEVTVQGQIFIETFIGAEVKPYTQSLQLIAVYPVVPGTDHVIPDIQISCPNKIQDIGIGMKSLHVYQRVHHFINRLFVFAQFFMTVVQPEGIGPLTGIRGKQHFFQDLILFNFTETEVSLYRTFL